MTHTHIQHNSIDSTNLEAKRLIQSGKIGQGITVISAKSQTGGKGRLGRSWVSEEGNLFASFIVSRLSFIVDGYENHELQTINNKLPFLSALAIGATIKEFTNKTPLYKWPNDVLIEGEKISGVLIETIADYFIIGIGINIASYPLEGTKLPATCLDNHTKDKNQVSSVLETLIKNMENKMHMDAASVRHEWMENAYGMGKEAVINQGDKEISGIFRGIDANGGLILETKGSKREAVLFGDISWI